MKRVLALGIAAGLTWLATQTDARAGEPRPIEFFFPRPAAKANRTAKRVSNHRVITLEDAEDDREATAVQRYQTVPYRRTYGSRTAPVSFGARYGVGYAYPAYGAYYGSGYYGAPLAYPMYGYSYGYNYGGAPYAAHCYSRGPCCDPCPPPRSRCGLLGGLFDGLFGGCCSEPCCPPPAPPACCYDPCMAPGGVIMGPPPGMPVETQSPVSPPQYAPQSPMPPTPGDTVSPPTPIEKKGTAPSAYRFPQLIIPDGRPS